MSNVFLSWSGNSSKSAAQVLRAWLPTVVQNIRPYMSAEDIDKGERWSIDITRQLEETNFGIICMTPENIAAPWVLFEAGALSKSIERSRVSPLLFGLNPSDFTKSPLLQFQLTVFSKDDVLKLLQSINNSSSETERLRDDVLQTTFDRSWRDLEVEIAKIHFTRDSPSSITSTAADTTGSNKIGEILEELLSIGRAQTKLMRTPEELFPPQYLGSILRDIDRRGITPNHPVWSLLDREFDILKTLFETVPNEQRDVAVKTMNDINRHLTFLRRGSRSRFITNREVREVREVAAAETALREQLRAEERVLLAQRAVLEERVSQLQEEVSQLHDKSA